LVTIGASKKGILCSDSLMFIDKYAVSSLDTAIKREINEG
jgi:threonine aldolase